jgi:superfamily II DNA or RNA helicase
MKLNLKWVSETIGEDYKNWTNGAVIRIEAQTGTGKTAFIKTKLLEHAINNGKRILYICNRINLKRQMKIDVARKQNIEMNYNEFDVLDSLEEIGNITITSYQKIQYYLLNERHQLNYKDVYTKYLNFDYIVLDEAHYIVQDASFANETVFFYRDYLKQCNKNCITILVSATMDYMKEPLLEEIYADSERKIYNYTTGIDYSYINAYYFNKYEDIITTINNDNSGNKWLIFINNLNKAKEINGKIKGSKFICSEYNQYASQMDKDELDNIIINNRFECKCLIATKVIDNGININDSLLTNIVIIALDKVDFIQMLGRKRIDIKEAQNINLYIMARYKKTFSTLIYDNYNLNP